MNCAPNLLKFLGIKLSLEIVKPKAFAEQRLFQAILVQALEDAVNTSGFKKETYHKHDSHKWFVSNSVDFQDVCWGADMDPDFVRGEYMKWLMRVEYILPSYRYPGFGIEIYIRGIENVGV